MKKRKEFKGEVGALFVEVFWCRTVQICSNLRGACEQRGEYVWIVGHLWGGGELVRKEN